MKTKKENLKKTLTAIFQDLELYSKKYGTTPQELIKSGNLPVSVETMEKIKKYLAK